MRNLKTYESFQPEEYWEEELDNVFIFDHRIYKREEIPFKVGDDISIDLYLNNKLIIPIHKIGKIKKIFKTYNGFYVMKVQTSSPRIITRSMFLDGIKRSEIKLINTLEEGFEPHYENIDPYEEEWESEEPYTEFEEWLLTRYPDENKWSEIKELGCFYINLTSLKGIEKLTNLEELYCHFNNLTSLDGIENLTNLKKLNCSYNNLTSLEGIENLRNLKVLYCHFNNLTSLDGIENLTNLEVLYCYNNKFSEEYKQYLRRYCRKNKIYLNI